MKILEKNDNIKKYNEKKNYRQPQLAEIGKVNRITKGQAGLLLDGLTPVSFPTS